MPPPQQDKALIVDLDGVLTRTAHLHAEAWKRLFDELLEQRKRRGEPAFEPFDIEADYGPHVDGKPREDGIRDFLASRGIELPEGNVAGDEAENAEPSPERHTVTGLARRKNTLFHDLLGRGEVEVFGDTVALARAWRVAGRKTVVVSSSRNCRMILEAAGLTELFDVRVDGVDVQRGGLRGKPAPDLFLEAARQLGVDPADATVIEDAPAGVEAAKRGGFGCVIGIVRTESQRPLRRAGADRVLTDLRTLVNEVSELEASGVLRRETPPSPALERLEEITRRLSGRRPAVFLDYDGTLTPIVAHPKEATLSERMRRTLAELAERFPVAIISGRDRGDVAQLVGLSNLYYAGSHGFDIAGPDGLRREHEEAAARLGDLDRAERELRGAQASIEGCEVERKRFAIAMHYRNVEPGLVPRIEREVGRVRAALPALRKRSGKKVFELQPDVDWDKGRAVRWLLSALELGEEGVVPIYIGDDRTDEDAFAALAGRGIGVFVGESGHDTGAEYRLADPEEVGCFLRELLDYCEVNEAARVGPEP